MIVGRHVATGALSLVVAGCAEEDVERRPDAQSAYVDLYLDDGFEVCAGTLDAYDGFIERAFDFWTTGPPPGDFVAPMHVLHRSVCQEGGSCVSRGAAWLTRQDSEFHEIAHMMHQATDGSSAFALQEGIAVALGDFPYAGQLPEETGTDFLLATSAETLPYSLAGVFTRFLIERHGVDAFRGHFRAMGAVDDPQLADFEREFESAFGEGLENVWPVFLSEPRCTYDLKLCGGMATPVDIPFEVDEGDVACDDPRVMGFADSDPGRDFLNYSPYRILTFELDEESNIALEGSNVAWLLVSCGDCVARSAPITPGHRLPWQAVTTDPFKVPLNEDVWPTRLAAGKYAILVRPSRQAPFRFSFNVY